MVQQFDLVWGIASVRVLPAVPPECLYWEPSPGALNVHRAGGGWRVDWWDEQGEPPDSTVAWVLWRLGWWGENVLRGVRGLEPLDPAEFPWVGGLDRVRAKLSGLAGRWHEVLLTVDTDTPVVAPWRETVPLVKVAMWANIELARDITQVGMLVRQYANRRSGQVEPVPAPVRPFVTGQDR